jgi:hypothetical protein
MQLPWWTLSLSVETVSGVRILTTTRARAGTRPAAFLPRRSIAEDDTGMIGTGMTLFTTEMDMAKLKISAKSEIASNRNGATKGTMIITVPSMTNLTDSVPLKRDAMKKESRLFS